MKEESVQEATKEESARLSLGLWLVLTAVYLSYSGCEEMLL